jgi:hypothetical protein
MTINKNGIKKNIIKKGVVVLSCIIPTHFLHSSSSFVEKFKSATNKTSKSHQILEKPKDQSLAIDSIQSISRVQEAARTGIDSDVLSFVDSQELFIRSFESRHANALDYQFDFSIRNVEFDQRQMGLIKLELNITCQSRRQTSQSSLTISNGFIYEAQILNQAGEIVEEGVQISLVPRENIRGQENQEKVEEWRIPCSYRAPFESSLAFQIRIPDQIQDWSFRFLVNQDPTREDLLIPERSIRDNFYNLPLRSRSMELTLGDSITAQGTPGVYFLEIENIGNESSPNRLPILLGLTHAQTGEEHFFEIFAPSISAFSKQQLSFRIPDHLNIRDFQHSVRAHIDHRHQFFEISKYNNVGQRRIR